VLRGTACRSRVGYLGGAIALLATIIVALLGASPAAAASCAEGVREVGDTVYGTACADVIVVDEPGIKEIRGGDGNDTLVAAGDVDFISAGGGNDVIVATPEVSEVFGGEGDDEIYGDTEPSSVEFLVQLGSGGSVANALSGPYACDPSSPGAGVCYMPDSEQTYNGGAGNDIIFGQRGNDTIFGAEGNDRLYGGIGDDAEIHGGSGEDLLSGGAGSDTMFGAEDNDIVRGDTNADTLKGGAGSDTLSYATGATPGFEPSAVGVTCGTASPCPGFPIFSQGTGVSVNLNQVGAQFAINNGTSLSGGGQDTIDDAFENVIGTPFADYIVGDGNANKIIGGGGADVINAGGGNDNINGGADGDYLDGGAGTDEIAGGTGVQPTNNRCANGEVVSECGSATQSVVNRDTSKVAVGMVGTTLAGTSYQMIYIVGSLSVDEVFATASGPHTVVIQSRTTGPAFDAAQQGCEFNAAHKITCTPANLDAIVLAGIDGGDLLDATSEFPGTVSPILLGGSGDDRLEGAETTEDLLVDGSGTDTLLGFAHDDDLISGEGEDFLQGGPDNDVLVSSTICDGGSMAGEGGADDIAWAQVPTPHRAATLGVWASLTQKKAAQVGLSPSIASSCPAGGKATDLLTAENLEGTSGVDRLEGDSERNFLLGRAGVDNLFGFAGEDVLQANAGDHDGNLDGGADADRLKRDIVVDGDTLIDRDNASTEGDAVENLEPIYAGNFTPIEEEKIYSASAPVAYFTLGEWTQGIAYEGPEREPKSSNGSYIGGVTRGLQGALLDSDDPAVGLDGVDDAIELPNNWDPATFSATGYSVELWVNLVGEQGGQTRYLFSKFNGFSGVYLYRNPAGNFVFGTRAGNNQFDVISPGVVSTTGWRHLVGTLNGNTTTLYIDGVPTSTTFGQSVFPPLANVAANRVGNFEGTGFLAAEVDMLSIYNRALTPTEVAQHDALTR
jgi:Ca2+-binding RTX toxin-like protein